MVIFASQIRLYIKDFCIKFCIAVVVKFVMKMLIFFSVLLVTLGQGVRGQQQNRQQITLYDRTGCGGIKIFYNILINFIFYIIMNFFYLFFYFRKIFIIK